MLAAFALSSMRLIIYILPVQPVAVGRVRVTFPVAQFAKIVCWKADIVALADLVMMGVAKEVLT